MLGSFSKQEQECMTVKQILKESVEVIPSIIYAEGIQKALSTLSNALMDCYALLAYIMSPWSHFYKL